MVTAVPKPCVQQCTDYAWVSPAHTTVPCCCSRCNISCLIKCVCQQCGLYFPSQSGRRSHSRVHNSVHSTGTAAGSTHNDDTDDADTATRGPSDAAGADAPATECMPVVCNLFEWLQSAFVDTILTSPYLLTISEVSMTLQESCNSNNNM